MAKQIPDIVIGRLPVYLRALQQMLAEGRQVTSSQELGERLGISAAQIRKDLSQFGEFGKQGTGYNIEYLANQVREILKVNKTWEVVIVGAGDIGRALAGYSGFSERGFKIRDIFDNSAERIGEQHGEFVIKDIATLKSEAHAAGIKMAMIAVPANAAQAVADVLVDAGIQAILSYAPVNLNVPPGVRVQNIDPSIHLQRMTYYLD
ncbi:MAG: redox-sensing transcriptional repressor Rex [Anaerolineales bacterium]|nr:redox-sensing transcriptional repressor Rex [Anaerolineales bacterium]